MKKLIGIECLFYGIGIAGIGFQQLQYLSIRPVLLPPWPASVHTGVLGALLTGSMLIIGGIMIAIRKKARMIALILGGLFLALFILFHVPYLLFINQYSPTNLGLWTDPLKELALSGGAFVIAGLFKDRDAEKSSLFIWLEKLIPAGRVFFSITMIAFGIDHFLYTDFVATLVPAWIPGHTFWTYFGGVALIASGLAIIFKIKHTMAAQLLAVMLFIWFIVLHIPRAIADPYQGYGNEITSVFEALAFSGIGLAIAFGADRKTALHW